MSSPTINGTKRLTVPTFGPLTPIHIGGIPAANDETPTPAPPIEEPTVAPEPAFDPVALAEADRIRKLAEAEAEAIRTKAAEEARKQQIANDKAAAKAVEEQEERDARIAALRRKRAEDERAAENARTAETAKEAVEADQAKTEADAGNRWRRYALTFYAVCAIVAMPVQIAAFWNPRAPWLVVAPLMLEGGAWVVLKGAAAAVASHRPHWHYRLIAWLLALIAAGINLWHGMNAFDPATAIGTAFASLAGPGIWDLHEHGRIRLRDGVLTRRERRAKEAAEKDVAKEKAAREAAAKAEKDAAAKAAKDAADKLAKDRETKFPKVWDHALKLAAALGETTVTEAVWRRAHKDVEGTDPGDSAEAQQLRNTAARKLLDARADAPDKRVWKGSETTTNAQARPQVPPTRRKGPAGGPPVRGVRRPGDTEPFVNAARTQAAITAKNTAPKTAREDS